MIDQTLPTNIDFVAWYDNAEETVGSKVGSEHLNWPIDKADRVNEGKQVVTMSDIKDPRLLWLKGALFLLLGVLAIVMILTLYPSIRLALLLVVAVWAFCRAYYFAFYVIQHYIDPTYRFSGLLSVIRCLAHCDIGSGKRSPDEPPQMTGQQPSGLSTGDDDEK